VKYTDTGEIRIAVALTPQSFSLLVSDTGKGMAAELVALLNNEASFIPDYSASEIKKFKFGYRIIKDLLQVIQAKMEIQSIVNKGTVITINFLSPDSPDTTNV
jgi:signal transduction histidine kinase